MPLHPLSMIHPHIPFTLAVHLVLAERDVLDLIFTPPLFQPSPNIIIGGPPVQLRDHDRRRGTRVDRATVVGLLLCFVVAQVVGVVLSLAMLVLVYAMIVIVLVLDIVGMVVICDALVTVRLVGLVLLLLLLVVGRVAVKVDIVFVFGHLGEVLGRRPSVRYSLNRDYPSSGG